MRISHEQHRDIYQAVFESGINSGLHMGMQEALAIADAVTACLVTFSDRIRQDEEFSGYGPDITEKELKKMQGARSVVFDIMKDGNWRTIDLIRHEAATRRSAYIPPQSVAIYLRSFREPRYGGYDVQKRKMSKSRVFEYRLFSDNNGN